MEMRRNIVLVALLAVGYLLFFNWNKDYGPKEDSAPASTATAAVGANVASGDLPKLASESSSDVPMLAQPSTPPVTKSSVPQPASDWIKVTTDVLNIAIDPVGGDVVYASLNKYPMSIANKKPFVLLQDDAERVFLARSGLTGTNGPDIAATGRPRFSSTQMQYVLQSDKKTLDVVLSFTDAQGVHYDKIYSFSRASYLVKISYRINNNSSAVWNGAMFGQLRRDNSKDPSAGGRMGLATYLGAAYTTSDKLYNKLAFDDFEKKPLKLAEKGGWIAMVQHYFVTAWVPDDKQQNTLFSTYQQDRNLYDIGYTSPNVTVAPGATATLSSSLYMGPKVQDDLKAISKGLDLTVDYGILWMIAQFLFWLLLNIHQYLISNWGWAVIVLTIVVKGAFWPLSAASYRSMAAMRRVAPEMQRMKERFGDDRQKMSQAMMELYRKEKINPLGGCLPMLVQMPVFIALYWTLMESVELRQADFMFWIRDLSAMDPYFVLPLLMGASMLIQQRLNPEPPDPMQARVMKLMPIIFTGFFLFFPSGLVLYWLVSNIISIFQQWYITKRSGALA